MSAPPRPAWLASRAWLALAVLATAIAGLALMRWIGAIALHGPVHYGEGAVAHAAILSREGAEYFPVIPPAFIAANYTPLYFHIAGLGDPFVWGRIVSIACVLLVALAIGWRARGAGPVVTLALAASWLALAPVAIWGPALKPDLLALALTVGAVLLLDRSGPRAEERAGLAGIVITLAVFAKPTAALPALALGAWLLIARRPRSAASFATAGIVASAVGIIATPGGLPALRRHVIEHNALPWGLEQALLTAALGLLVAGVPLVAALVLRAPRGPVAAYLAGAAGIMLLSGREGATINYLLDITAAAALALAGVAPSLRARAVLPALAAAQLVAGAFLLDPLGFVPERSGTGAWGRPERVAAARALPGGFVLAEDPGLLVAQGRDPTVDDLFLWSRLAERGSVDREPLLAVIRAGAFVRVVSDADLATLESGPAFRRQRWPAWLAAAVLERYTLDRREGGLHIYRAR